MSTTTTDLALLLSNLSPELAKESWMFCVVPEMPAALACTPLMTFHEPEGLTLIVPKSAAESSGLRGSGPYRQIILTVHSSLEAVGLTAAVSSALTGAGISCNIVAAFHHDHVFVRDIDAERALAVLKALSANPEMKTGCISATR
jgi:hypothetical protein